MTSIGDVVIVGAGSMGTAVAQLVSRNAKKVFLVARRKEIVESINRSRVNAEYFPTLKLAENIQAFTMDHLAEAKDVEALIMAVPSGSIREVARHLGKYWEGEVIVSVAKGIEHPSLKTMSRVISEETHNDNIVAISGPTFADEIAFNHTAGCTLGIPNESLLRPMKRMFRGLMLDHSQDVVAVELCGILKNVYAIAVGMWDSAMSGHNGHYAFLNLCFGEMRKILGAVSTDREIAMKFCCFGDLSLTCNVGKSRNRTLGLMVGKRLVNANGFAKGIVMEGVKSAKGANTLASRHGIDAPIVSFVTDVLEGKEDINVGICKILQKSLMIDHRRMP